MGQDVSGTRTTPEQTRAFSKALLRDLRALERMLSDGLIESGVRRTGVEQEMFLVNEGWRPTPAALEVLERLDGPFGTELALFNLEANVEPHLLEGGASVTWKHGSRPWWEKFAKPRVRSGPRSC